MRGVQGFSLALALAVLWPGCQLLAQPPDAWLEGADQAFSRLNYDGVFSYFTGEDVVTLRIVHMLVDGKRHERLAHLNGPPRELIRSGDVVKCLWLRGDKLPELARGIAAGPFARAFAPRLGWEDGLYAVTDIGLGRIAGRPAKRLAVTPKDGNRYGYRLWLDRQHRLLLRSEVVDVKGARLEVFQFARITIGDGVSSSALEPNKYEGAQMAVLEPPAQRPAAAMNGRPGWRAGWVPAGFRITKPGVRSSLWPRSGARISMMYSDGLSAFSVFVEKAPETGFKAAAMRQGATVALMDFVADPSGGQAMVTLVGEVPEAAAKRIVRSVHRTMDVHQAPAP